MLRKIVLWILSLGVATAIFSFSAQPAKKSDKVSISVTKKVISVLSGVKNLPQSEKTKLVHSVHSSVRKWAHFSLYFCLGILVLLLCQAYGLSFPFVLFLAMGICILYAVTDELHQLLVPGRSGEVRDVLIDSCGSLTGMLPLMGIQKLLKRKKR